MTLTDIEKSIPEGMIPQLKEEAGCPSVKGWPEDDFAKWVSSHRDNLKMVICNSRDYQDAPFCGAAFD